MIQVIRDATAEEFLRAAGTFLYHHEPDLSLMIGLCERLVVTGSPDCLFVRVTEGGKTVAAATQTSRHNLILSYSTLEHLEILAKNLHQQKVSFPGVVGPVSEVKAFCQLWCELRGLKVKLGMDQKIYTLNQVCFPEKFVGEFRHPADQDKDLLADWIVSFTQECLPEREHATKEQALKAAENYIQAKSILFILVNGVPVAMANSSRPTKNGVTINLVYTPHHFRKKGYASMVVAQLSQNMLNAGKKFCVLYTDTSNPTSNKIYQKLGYQEIAQSLHLLIE